MRLHWERRPDTPWWLAVVVTLTSIAGALAVGALFLELTGLPSGTVYSKMFESAFGSSDAITDTLATGAPLILTGLAAAFAMRMGLYNIGGEGQLYAGAIASSGAALAWCDGAPRGVAVTIVFVAGAAGGMAWILVPALARAFAGTSEIVTTLMMVFVADLLLDYLITGSHSYWRDPLTIGFPQGKQIPDAARFTRWFDNSRITVALVVAAAMIVVLWFVWARTSFGFGMKVIGDSPDAARYSGIPARRTILIALLVSGALAGMAGATEIGARAYRLDPAGLRLSLGYTGIVIAALARRNPFAVGLVAVLIGALQNAGQAVQTIAGVHVPRSVALMLQGAILLFVLGGEVYRTHQIRIVRHHDVVEAPAAVPS
jgi:simple sugar transport system permease protein